MDLNLKEITYLKDAAIFQNKIDEIVSYFKNKNINVQISDYPLFIENEVLTLKVSLSMTAKNSLLIEQ